MMNQETIIKFTAKAIEHIKKNIAQQSGHGFRLAVKKTGCSGYAYVPDIVAQGKEGDIALEVEKVAVFIDKDSVKFLSGTVIDYVSQEFGQAKLVFHNPNAANLCGCGESFNLIEKD